MTEYEFQDALKAVLREIALMDEDEASDAGVPEELVNLRRVRTYQEDGVLSSNAGLVVTTAGGTELQLTIVRSR